MERQKEIIWLGKYIERNFSDRGNVYSVKGISPTLQAVMETGGHHVPCIAVMVRNGKRTAV